MSRWSRDPDAAADELIGRSLAALALQGRVLLAYHAGRLPNLLADQGVATAIWSRRMIAGIAAQPWPPAGPFDAVLLRLPRAKDEQEMAAHASLGVLVNGGRLIVYGGNDEGIRSAGLTLVRLAGNVDTLATRGHGRVLSVRRPTDIAHLCAALADWHTLVPLDIGAQARAFAIYPGLFAAGRIDDGTALLISALPPLRAGNRVLDYGCGAGVIGASALAAQPGITLDMLDDDAVAIEAARTNVPGARHILGSSLADVPGPYDAILSNPPLHKGFAEDHTLLEQLIADAPRQLRPGGCLQLVVQRRLPLERLLGEHFASVTIAAETARYRVWRAVMA